MSSLKVRDISSSLLKKGFVQHESDHTHYTFYKDNQKTSVWTKISHGERDIGDTLINIMQKQLKLTKKQFLDFVNCPLSKEEYRKILLDSNSIK